MYPDIRTDRSVARNSLSGFSRIGVLPEAILAANQLCCSRCIGCTPTGVSTIRHWSAAATFPGSQRYGYQPFDRTGVCGPFGASCVGGTDPAKLVVAVPRPYPSGLAREGCGTPLFPGLLLASRNHRHTSPVGIGERSHLYTRVRALPRQIRQNECYQTHSGHRHILAAKHLQGHAMVRYLHLLVQCTLALRTGIHDGFRSFCRDGPSK